MCSTRRHRADFDDIGTRNFRSQEPPADMRVGDAERERALVALRRHAAEGRLSAEELEERVEAALNARNHGELRALFHDLPDEPRRIQREQSRRNANAEHFRVYLAVCALLVAIWAVSRAGYFWPIWVIACWGMVFLMPGCGPWRAPRSRRGEAIRV